MQSGILKYWNRAKISHCGYLSGSSFPYVDSDKDGKPLSQAEQLIIKASIRSTHLP